MRKRIFLIKDLLFLTGLAFLCAKIAQAVILSQVLGYTPTLTEKVQPQDDAQQEATLPLRAYEAISLENIFNSKSGKDDESKAVAQEETEQPMEETELNVLLLGTAIGPPADTFAVIEDRITREQDLYQVGDMVQEEARIVKVSRCRVVLNRDGTKEALECIEPDERHPRQSRRMARRTQQNPESGIRKVSRNRYWIDQERVESALANVNKLMTQARVVPSLRGGKNQGWKLFAIRPKSIFKQIGLKSGDVIQSINGRDLLTPSEALEVFRELREATHFEVELMRKGRTRTLNYEIR
jgi:general secretion pathway protein C